MSNPTTLWAMRPDLTAETPGDRQSVLDGVVVFPDGSVMWEVGDRPDAAEAMQEKTPPATEVYSVHCYHHFPERSLLRPVVLASLAIALALFPWWYGQLFAQPGTAQPAPLSDCGRP